MEQLPALRTEPSGRSNGINFNFNSRLLPLTSEGQQSLQNADMRVPNWDQVHRLVSISSNFNPKLIRALVNLRDLNNYAKLKLLFMGLQESQDLRDAFIASGLLPQFLDSETLSIWEVQVVLHKAIASDINARQALVDAGLVDIMVQSTSTDETRLGLLSTVLEYVSSAGPEFVKSPLIPYLKPLDQFPLGLTASLIEHGTPDQYRELATMTPGRLGNFLTASLSHFTTVTRVLRNIPVDFWSKETIIMLLRRGIIFNHGAGIRRAPLVENSVFRDHFNVVWSVAQHRFVPEYYKALKARTLVDHTADLLDAVSSQPEFTLDTILNSGIVFPGPGLDRRPLLAISIIIANSISTQDDIDRAMKKWPWILPEIITMLGQPVICKVPLDTETIRYLAKITRLKPNVELLLKLSSESTGLEQIFQKSYEEVLHHSSRSLWLISTIELAGNILAYFYNKAAIQALLEHPMWQTRPLDGATLNVFNDPRTLPVMIQALIKASNTLHLGTWPERSSAFNLLRRCLFRQGFVSPDDMPQDIRQVLQLYRELCDH